MTDIDHLARRARATLAEAHSATLLVEGWGRAEDPTVTLHDRDGVPTLFCAAGSPVATAAEQSRCALLTVAAPVDDGPRLTLLLAGQLVPARVEQVDGVGVQVVTLRLRSVVVECEHGSRRPAAQYEVPLARYLRAGRTDLAAAAARIRAHTNHAHADELRRLVATTARIPLGSVAGVTLAQLDATGAVLHWVDVDGAHSTQLRFTAPARCPRELAERLRARLRGAPRRAG